MTLRTVLSADGRLRRAFTVKDVERMVEVGLIDPDERLEIVAGELLPMSPKGARHEVLKIALLERLFDRRSPEQRIAVEPGWRLGDMLYLEPDLLIYPASLAFPAVRGRDALMVIEIADATLGNDLGPKASLYAAEGVLDYWVVDAATRETHLHRQPGPDGYATVQVVPPTETVTAALIPFGVRMADLSER